MEYLVKVGRGDDNDNDVDSDDGDDDDGGCEPVGGYARFSGSRQQLQHQPARW